MHEKDGAMARLMSFAEDKGFYIILMLCVVAIGISGYVLFFAPTGEQSDFGLQPGAEPGVPAAAAEKPERVPVIPDVRVELEPEPEEVPVIPPKPVEAPASAPAEVQTWLFHRDPSRLMPVSGPIIRGYSMDTLVYDVTMGDWRTHDGIDIACTVGDEVRAPADGTVIRAGTDDLLGGLVEIDHGDGLTTLLCGLSADGLAQEGQKVTAGQTVGRAGGTMKTESLLEPHVHLSALRDGVSVDPESLNLK